MPSSTLTPEQIAILQSSSESRLVAIAYRAGRRNYAEELPIVGGQVEDDGDAAVPRSLSLLIADADGSLIPTDYSSPLSPYGGRLFIQSEHKLGDAVTRIPIGWFQISELPDFHEQKDQYRTGQWVHRGAAITVKARGLFQVNSDELFEAPEQSVPSASTYAEARRISRIPITASLPDKPLPSTPIVYDANRNTALSLLAENLGGIPFETADGTWSVRPKVAGEPVWTLAYGDSGGVVTPPRTISRDGFANVFIVRNDSSGAGGSKEQVQGRATIDAGPLSVGGPMGRVPRIVNNQLMTTSALALAEATRLRDEALLGTPFTIKVSCLANPTLIPGDVVAFDYFERQLKGEILKSTVAHFGLQTLELLVNPGGDPWA